MPLGVPRVHVIHRSVTLPQLRDVFQRRWLSIDATVLKARVGQGQGQGEGEGGGGEAQQPPPPQPHVFLYSYLAVASNLDFCILNNLYHDLIEEKIMHGSTTSTCERYTQAALAVALTYLHRRLFGDYTIGGVERRDVSAVLMGQLKHAFGIAYKNSSAADKAMSGGRGGGFGAAFLWVLYVGALCEHAQAKGSSGISRREERDHGHHPARWYFSPLLACQARLMGVGTWRRMQGMAREFFYVSGIEPDGERWFEELLDAYRDV